MYASTAIVLHLTTQNIEKSKLFYENVLGFTAVLELVKPPNSSEIVLYNPNLSNNLLVDIKEFSGTYFVKPSNEHLLVFYLNNEEKYSQIIEKMQKAKVLSVKSNNPYWDQYGKTFLAPDNYRIVFCPGGYKNYKARIARPTQDILKSIKFYTEDIGLEKIGEFKDHAGFDGIMLAAPGLDCHLEMTYQHEHANIKQPSGYGLELVDQAQLTKNFVDNDGYSLIISSGEKFKHRYLIDLTSAKAITSG